MRLLLDTATFLWIATDDPRLSKRARESFANPNNEILLSAVSGWEIAVKYGLGRLPLPDPPAEFVPTRRKVYRIESLPLDEESVLYVTRLPKIHADPFDRMLICQAIIQGLALLTPDECIAQYPVRVLW